MKKKNDITRFGQQTTKVQQLADKISLAISINEFRGGDSLPSINQISNKYKVSRDTVFKAFANLRERGLIDSIPGKNYFVTNHLTKVLLLLDQYTPFKETLYNSFIKHLPLNYKVDLLFHQYNQKLFDTIIHESVGKYNKYVVMNFDNEKLSAALKKIPANKLLLLDFGKFEKAPYSYICQDFDNNLYTALSSLKNEFSKYKEFIMLFPKELKHPLSSRDYFIKFCKEHHLKSKIIDNIETLQIEQNKVYFAIKQQDVVKVVKSGREAHLKCGKDFGLLAYNDIPSYDVIENGITSLTVNWEIMGNKAAKFVLDNTPIHEYLPTEVKLRHSL